MKIGVLNGGNSEEREVSLNSGSAIISACKELGHDVISIDPINGIDSLMNDLKNLDLVFNGLHGGDGENGVIQGLLQTIGVRFTGSSNEASAICMDKRLSKSLVKQKKILTPEWISLDKDEEILTNEDGKSSDQPDDVGGDELEEIESDRKKNETIKYKIQEVIKKNQIILIQISKEERGNKGAAATTYISIPGRYCVLMPNTLTVSYTHLTLPTKA